MNNKEFLERFGEYSGNSDLDYCKYEGLIKRAVRESIDRVLSEDNLLLEYYGTRADFKRHIKNRFEQIFQNYCLVLYGRANGFSLARHWLTEYDAHINYLRDFQITNNNSSKSRYKVLTEAFNEALSKFDNIVNSFKKNKLADEGIDPNSEIIANAIDSFLGHIETIKEYLARLINNEHAEFV